MALRWRSVQSASSGSTAPGSTSRSESAKLSSVQVSTGAGSAVSLPRQWSPETIASIGIPGPVTTTACADGTRDDRRYGQRKVPRCPAVRSSDELTTSGRAARIRDNQVPACHQSDATRSRCHSDYG